MARGLPLRAKLFAASVIAFVAVTLTLTASQAALLQRTLHRQLIEQAASQQPFILAAFAVPLVERDYATVHAIVREAVRDNGLAHLAVVDRRGAVVAAHGWTESMAGAPSDVPVAANGTRRLPFEADVVFGGQLLGRVHYGLSYEPVDAAIHTLLSRSLIIALGCLIPTIIVIELLHARFTRPLTALMRASEQIRAGDYDVVLAPSRQREFGALIESFARMSREIRERVDRLTRSEAAERALRASAEERETALLATKAELQARESELAAALEDQRALTAEQRRFVAVAAHEFRTPLTIIDGAAQRLARHADDLPPAELRERTARIRAAVARMSRLIDDTLAAARVEAGAASIDLRDVDLGELLSSVRDHARSFAGEVEIRFDPPETPVTVEGDKRLLEQVFVNLVSNAVKYSGDGRRVELSLEGAEDAATIVVRDRGIGIPEAEMSGLFGRFFRATTATGIPGTGLGLSLARSLVERHRGTIDIVSRVGSGTTVTVRLPRRQPRPDTAAA